MKTVTLRVQLDVEVNFDDSQVSVDELKTHISEILDKEINDGEMFGTDIISGNVFDVIKVQQL